MRSGTWRCGARQTKYGAERPLDDPLHSKPYIAYEFGLFTGSAVRWYVEGETEYFAITHLFQQNVGEPSTFGIELVNLYGGINLEKHNAALKLQDGLQEDKKHRRFSVISFDKEDGSANEKAIGRQIQLNNVVGSISAHNPDFEFANFTIRELVEVAARIV